MDYRQLGSTGLRVSELCLGTMTFGWMVDEQTTYQILVAFADAGGNFMDTADVYPHWAPGNPVGVCETYLGNWLKGQIRDRFVIATKVGGRMWSGPDGEGLSRQHILTAVEGSLKRLQTDYIDLYQCHAPDDHMAIEETLQALNDLVCQGKVRAIGCSNYTPGQAQAALQASDKSNLARFGSVQPHYNLAHRAEFEREWLALCVSEGLGVIPYSSLAGGFLTGKYRKGRPLPPGSRTVSSLVHYEMYHGYVSDQNWALIDLLEMLGQARSKTVAQMALGWLLTQPVITSPIVGASNLTQLREILGAVGLRLNQDELNKLDAASCWKA